jgi:hypothetical protein
LSCFVFDSFCFNCFCFFFFVLFCFIGFHILGACYLLVDCCDTCLLFKDRLLSY